MPNFVLLDIAQLEITHLLTAMLQAREAVGRRSWSHPQEPTGDDWWADVLADPRARNRNRRTNVAVRQDTYRLSDEPRGVILVACSKCEWRAAFERDELITIHGATCAMPCSLQAREAGMSQARKSVGPLWRLLRRADRCEEGIMMLQPLTPDGKHRSRIMRTLVVLVAIVVIGYLLGLIYWPDLLPWSR
jgi:hypothetical protein